MESLVQVAAELLSAERIAILSHVLPDGDCIGSMLALGRALEAKGKYVILLNNDQVPEYLKFLPGTEKVLGPDDVQVWPELIVCVDCSDMGRLGDSLASALEGRRLVNIDHHVSNTHFGSFNYVAPEAAATGQIIADLVKVLGVPIDQQMAELIYAAIVTDTGSFQYSNTSEAIHQLTAELIIAGINVSEINQKIYETKSLEAVKLLGKALYKLQISPDGKIAWIVLTREDLQEFGARDEHTEGIINFTRSISSVEVGMLFRETLLGQVKVGFRSKQVVDVNKLAGTFGGGGHQRASGCTIKGETLEVVNRVITKAQEFVGG